MGVGVVVLILPFSCWCYHYLSLTKNNRDGFLLDFASSKRAGNHKCNIGINRNQMDKYLDVCHTGLSPPMVSSPKVSPRYLSISVIDFLTALFLAEKLPQRFFHPPAATVFAREINDVTMATSLKSHHNISADTGRIHSIPLPILLRIN
jgi:hypothetical protein